MQLTPMTEADRLLFHAETLLDFLANCAALQCSAVSLLQDALSEDTPATLPDMRPQLAKLTADLHRALLALHSTVK
jgi:hypothetical protein